jgi:hypothetical protein
MNDRDVQREYMVALNRISMWSLPVCAVAAMALAFVAPFAAVISALAGIVLFAWGWFGNRYWRQR